MAKFIAEVSSNHHQDIERCLEFIDVSAKILCDSVKFQLFKLDELFSPEARFARPEFEERRSWELPVEFLPILKKRCESKGIKFSCTPFYIEAVEELEPFVDFYKIASYELLWVDLIIEVARTGKDLVLSTGMATIEEIGTALEIFRNYSDSHVSLLHCVSGYPTPVKDCNLAAIETIRDRFGVEVGWSDHSKNASVIQRAVSKWGASLVEFHLDLDGSGDEFKTGHCWLPNEIREVIDSVRNFSDMDGDGEKVPRQSEVFDRGWRADPSDGRRPLLSTRKAL